MRVCFAYTGTVLFFLTLTKKKETKIRTKQLQVSDLHSFHNDCMFIFFFLMKLKVLLKVDLTMHKVHKAFAQFYTFFE